MTRLDPVLPLIAEHKRLWERGYEEDWEPLEDAHAALYARILATAPTTLAGAIAQLEVAVEHDDPDMVKAALVGLRVIAAEHGEAQP
jgi:hypothetical protein